MPQDLVITPNRGSTTSGAQIAFTGYSGASSIYLKVLPDSSLSFEGAAGQLFSITDNLSSGTIFSVNDITGIPSFDVNANGLVRIAPYAGNVALGTTATSGRLQINTGSAATIGQIIQAASGQTANYTEWRNNSGNAIASVSPSSPNFNITPQVTSHVPLRISTSSGHSTNSLEIYHSGGLAAYISPDGILGVSLNYGGTQKSNTVINGGLGNPSIQYRNTIIGTSASVASGASFGEAVAVGFGAIAYGQYGVAVGQGTAAGQTGVALGLQASSNGADRGIAIGYLTAATYNFSCAFGTRAATSANGQFVFATETADPSFQLQRMNGSSILKGLYNFGGTWISNTNGAEISRVTMGPMYANSMQEAIRMDAASDLARVGIGGAASGRLCVYTGAATNKGVVIQGFTSQTANLTEWQNSAGSVIASINASGEFFGLIASGVVTSGEIGNAAVVSGSIASGAVGAYHFNATGIASGFNLRTDGTGILSWAAAAGGLTVSDDTSTNATRYLTFTSATTGSVSTINVSSTKLTFNPSTGDFTAGGNITANSDARIKTNIKTLENALDKVKSLRGVSFERKDSGIKNIGVIAQEVEAIVPELVRESDGLKSVAYGNIVALLIEAVKEQNKKIEELEKLCQSISNPS